MLKPSYPDLMKVLTKDKESAGLYSRYSIVVATSKRARQLIDGAEPYTNKASSNKPTSIAVQELYEGHYNIISTKQPNN